jgi:segregation and condensation protein A
VAYNFKLEQFEGPLDLLLKLIEEDKLDITTVSLAKVADEYLRYVESLETINVEELADFLVVAAKLLLIKSRSLLPIIQVAEDEIDLEKQLKIYREYLEASKQVAKMLTKKKFMYVREASPALMEPIFSPPPHLDTDMLKTIMLDVLAKIEPIIHIPEAVIERTISISEKIQHIKQLVAQAAGTNFHTLLGQANNRTEIIVTFLALLELIKEEHITVQQNSIFEDISITVHQKEQITDVN